MLNREIYHFIAETRYNQDKNIDDILLYAVKAYEIDRTQKILKTLISRTILRSFAYITPNKKSAEKLVNYEKEYPFITESNFYKRYVIRMYSYLTGQYFYKKQPEIGTTYFDKLKLAVEVAQKDKIQLDQEIIGNAYWSIGAYYYGKSKLKKAKTILEEGKKLAPEHHKLNKVLSYVNDDLE